MHIAAELLGHRNLDTTLSYTAVYPQEVIDRYQQFVGRRRALRPTEEYRAPTAAELADLLRSASVTDGRLRDLLIAADLLSQKMS